MLYRYLVMMQILLWAFDKLHFDCGLSMGSTLSELKKFVPGGALLFPEARNLGLGV